MDMAKPKIRFNGYTEDWEQRKLGELVGIYDGVHQTPDYQDSGIMFLSVENIVTLKSEKYIAEEAFERDYKVYPEKGDILMTRIGDVGTTNVVETAEKVAFYVSLALLKPNGIDSYFLSNAMKTNAFQKGLRERTLVTAIPQKINKDEIGKIDIFITNNDEEQKKIGAYFSNLDHLITLHQRKCEQTKTLKKYMLQKMFPQDGEKVPQIRFEGFTEDWEQRKLGDLTKELSDYATMASGLPLLTSSRSGLMYQSDFRDRKTTTSDETLFSIVPKGSCTYRHMSDDDIFHLNINVLEKGLVSREYPVFISSEDNDLEFIIQHINSSDRFRGFCKGQKKGGTRTRLYYKTLCEFEMMTPLIEEQKKISATLHNLDHLITLHQRKCDELKEVKKFMLQNMFV